MSKDVLVLCLLLIASVVIMTGVEVLINNSIILGALLTIFGALIGLVALGMDGEIG